MRNAHIALLTEAFPMQGANMTIHDIILLLESGVAIESDADGFRALIGDVWIRLDDPAVDVQVDTTVPELIAA